MKLGKIIKKYKSKKGKRVVVRVVTWDDLDDLLIYANELIKEDTFVMIHGKEITLEEEVDFLADSIKKTLRGDKLHFVIEINGDFAGSCNIDRQRLRSQHVGRIGISVSKKYRDEGIGTELMKTLISQGRQHKYKLLTLTCFSINKRAIAVYEKVGFKKAGVIPGAYKYKNVYEDELVMYKKL